MWQVTSKKLPQRRAVHVADSADLQAVSLCASPIFGLISARTASARNLDCLVRVGRELRPKINGGTYHVMNRGNRKARIFNDDRERRRFLRILIEEKETHGIDLLAGCQMENHFHLVVNTPHGNISEFMGELEGRFARYSNWRNDTVGHLFQGRFRDVVVDDDIHLLTTLCYVFLNPVSARLATKPEGYTWSTYAATVGLVPVPNYLTIDWLSSLFPGDSVPDGQARFRHLMTEAKPVAAYLQQNEADVDPEAVRRVIDSYVGGRIQHGLLPRAYRSALRLGLSELVPHGLMGRSRALAVYDAHVVHGYKLAEIARQLCLHPSTVSQIFRSVCESRISAAV